MSRIFFNSQSLPIHLSHKIGTGGEGSVYEIIGLSDFVAKIYHEPPSTEKAEKLVALSRLGNERLLKLAAWPVDVLHVENGGQLAGFMMKKIGQAEEVHALHSPKSRLKKFPEASWAFLIYVAANIARAVATIHEHSFIVGDLNPKNILVTHQATVALLDCDSFQVTADGKTFYCEGGFPEYLPPELQGLSLRDVERKQKHDCFGLAVVIFQLLFMGRHPFSGKFIGVGEITLEDAIRKSCFAFGADAAARQMQQPPGTLPLEAIPVSLNYLFRRAFLSADRPSPQEWIEPLESLAKSLKPCDLHTGHFYFSELDECPWCEIEMRARIRLFNFSLNGHNGRRSHFKLDEVWGKIESLQTQPAPMVLADMKTHLALPHQPSAEVAAFAKNRKNRLLLGVLFAVMAGFVIGYFVSWPLALLLVVLSALMAKTIARAELSPKIQVTNFFQQSLPTPNNSLATEIHQRLQNADQAVQQLSDRWDKMSSAANFQPKLEELKNRKEVYERLPHIREFKLKHLETTAHDRQLKEFLDKFEISQSQIKDIDFLTAASLRSRGIETAADVTPERLKHVPDLAEAKAQRLLFWRSGVKRQFKFDSARDVQVQDRINVEREMDNLRMQVEHELTRGAVYLQRLQHETESQRQQLSEALPDAYRLQAQAEKDWEIVQKQNPLWPLVMMLIIFFLYGVFLSFYFEPSSSFFFPPNTSFGDTSSPNTPSPDPAPASEEELSIDETEARILFEKGEKLMKQAKWKAAAKEFQRSTELNPKYHPAYTKLGYALYRLDRYAESVTALNHSLSLSNEFEPNYYLGHVYISHEQWEVARTSFVDAIDQSRDVRDPRFADSYYHWAQANVKLGQSEFLIEQLERNLTSNPELTLDRFQLAALYVWAGKTDLALRHHKILKVKDAWFANQLRRLMKEHAHG